MLYGRYGVVVGVTGCVGGRGGGVAVLVGGRGWKGVRILGRITVGSVGPGGGLCLYRRWGCGRAGGTEVHGVRFRGVHRVSTRHGFGARLSGSRNAKGWVTPLALLSSNVLDGGCALLGTG
jgi:hypothetical protein